MGLGDWFNKNILGSSNENTAEKPAVDSNAYNYGGYEGGATDAAMRYRENARNAQSRDAAQANYDGANRMNNMGLAARGDMNQVGQAQLARALGKVPSIAEMHGARQMGQVAAQQGALQASARGRGALANAATTAANNTANAQGAISSQTQINAAGERAAAEAAAAGTFAGMQAADAQRTGMAAQMSQYQATNQMQQRELNDRMTMDQLKNEMGVQGMQLGASQNLQAQRSANSLGAAGINAGVGGQNANLSQQSGMGLIGMGSSIAGGFATGGGSGSVTGKADGGPVQSGQPYLVGERGPELIVPHKDAMVLPAERTAPLLSRAMGKSAAYDLDSASGEDYGGRHPEFASDPGAIDLDDARANDVAKYGEARVRARETGMRDGSSEARTYNADKNMHRDTPADQANVKRMVQDQAAREADAMMAGYMAALKQAPQVASRLQAQPDDRLAARADGGPLGQGQPALVGERGPELVVPSTWGAGTSVEGVGDRTRDQYANEAARVSNEAAEAAKVESPWERDVRRHNALRAMGDREGAAMVAPEAGRSRAILRGAKQAQGAAPEAEAKGDPAEKQAVAEGKQAPPTLRSRLGGAIGTVGDGATKIANATDTGYRGPSSFAAPQLIPVMAPPRAMGGPMMAGMPYTVGEKGPEMVVPTGGMDMSQPGGPTQLSGGGMDVLGSLRAHSNFATKFQSDPTGGMVAREEGGPVAAGQKALVGERGPEMVVPQPSLLSRLGDSLRSAVGIRPETTAAPREVPEMVHPSAARQAETRSLEERAAPASRHLAADQTQIRPSPARRAETKSLEDEEEKKRKAAKK